MQQGRVDDVVEIDLLEVFGLLLQKAWLILLVAVVTAAVGFGVSAYAVTPQYQSTTSVYILNKQDSTQLSYSDTQLATQLTKDYQELITCRYVMEKVIEMCDLDMTYGKIKKTLTVNNATDTRIISITVENPNPATAQYIADSVRDVASEHIKKVMNIEAVNVVDKANLPEKPSSPSIMKWTVLGGMCGAMVVIGILLLNYLLDDTIKVSEDVEKYLGWSTLALIPVMQTEDTKKGKKKREKSRDYTKSESLDDSKAPGNKKDIEIVDLK